MTNFSHGFRKGRSQHKAIKELRENLIDLRINWILIADITGLFDNLDHEILRNLIKKRMNDGTLLRLIFWDLPGTGVRGSKAIGS